MARRTREEQRAETRRRLLEEAAAVFGEVGFHAASIEEITDRAGYSRGAFYSNFSSKEDLFLTMTEANIESRLGELREMFARDASTGVFSTMQQESETGDGLIDPIEAPGALNFTEFALHAARNPEWRVRLASLNSRVRATYADLVSAQAAHLGFAPAFPPAQLASMQMALEAGLFLQQVIEPGCVPLDFNMRFLEFVVLAMSCQSTSGPEAVDVP